MWAMFFFIYIFIFLSLDVKDPQLVFFFPEVKVNYLMSVGACVLCCRSLHSFVPVFVHGVYCFCTPSTSEGFSGDGWTKKGKCRSR